MADPKKKDWIVTLQGREYATWPWVLDEAHKVGLCHTNVELVQIPSEENGHCAIVKAKVFIRKSDTQLDSYEAYGDASPKNVNSKIATALIRMAETRAKGRALRDACNIGMTLKEELGPDTDDAPLSRHQPPPIPPSGDGPVMDLACSWQDCGQVCTPMQAKATKAQFQRVVCKDHLPEAAKAKVAGKPLN
jgi:hypothetical protein